MRTLSKNKTVLWKVSKTGTTENTDINGDYTGEIITQYSDPEKINLSLYPYSGEIRVQTFGEEADLDMVSVSNRSILNKDDLLFDVEPTIGDTYEETYTYKVNMVKKSLNTTNYGLSRRV